MNVIVSHDQDENVKALELYGMLSGLVPLKGRNSCAGIMEIAPMCYIIGERDGLRFVTHLILDASFSEAMGYFKALNSERGTKLLDARIEFIGARKDEADMN